MVLASLTFDDVLAMCASLPGIEEGLSYGTRAIKVKGKLIVRLKEDNETIVLKMSFVVRGILLHEQPDVFFLTDHYKNWPMVLVRLGTAKKKQLTELLKSAWRENAPAKLVREYDAI
ncbi:MAG: MmcQ/YjbR family DNA-binding protein [Gemmatimonadaceae bacterium]